MQRIVSICPAVGWNAVFLEDGPPYYHLQPVAVFGVVEECCDRECDENDRNCEHDRDSTVKAYVGMDMWEACEDCESFYGCVHDSNLDDEQWQEGWIEAAKKRIERLKNVSPATT